MSVDPTLVAALQNALIGASNLGYGSKAKSHDVYEAYTLSLAVLAARNLNLSVHYEDGFGNPTTTLSFRTSPGYIHSGGSFTHIVLTYPEAWIEPLEGHMGRETQRSLGVSHECDASILPKHIGDLARSGYRPRLWEQLVMAECKFYSSDLALGLSRAALGLADEGAQDRLLFVANLLSSSVATVLNHFRYRLAGTWLLTFPGSPAEAGLIHDFEQQLQLWRRNFI